MYSKVYNFPSCPGMESSFLMPLVLVESLSSKVASTTPRWQDVRVYTVKESRIWKVSGCTQSPMTKYMCISSYIWKPFIIHDFAPDPYNFL